MLLDRSRFRDHRLISARGRRNWRFLLMLSGAVLLLLAYLLPMFDAAHHGGHDALSQEDRAPWR